MRNLVALVLALAVLGVCARAEKKEKPQEYQMPSAEFEKKFGVSLDTIPAAPGATFAPIPPFPFKMRQQKLNGASAYVIQIDDQGNVTAVDLVNYSREEFGNGSGSLSKWRFGKSAKAGRYLIVLRYTLTPSAAMIERVL